MPKRSQNTGKAALQSIKRNEMAQAGGKKIESRQDLWVAGCRKRKKKEHGCPQ